MSAQGTDTLNFGGISTSVILDLGITTSQNVHTNRAVTLNSGATFENVIGGSSDDVLRGNTLPNSLTGNSGNDLLIGLSGNDTLTGGGGKDILVGGRDQDQLTGGSDEDLLIAAYTLSAAVEDSQTFLLTVRTQWLAATPFAARQAALTPILVPASTVINDGVADTLSSNGDLSLDWLFAALTDGVTRDGTDILSLI